jgi:uncharacterized protein (TIGR03086 family)
MSTIPVYLRDLDLVELDRRAVESSIDVVRRVRPGDLARPTPCSEWQLGDLLAHMTAQHRGFAAAGHGSGADLARWKPDPRAVDPVADYESAARGVLATFAADEVLEKSFVLPEISTAIEFPAAQAISFHFIDYVVHAWDVARSLGEPYVLAADLAPAAVRIAELVPDGPERLSEAAAFRPGLPAQAGVSSLDRVLLALGRSPNWPA